MTRTRIAKDFEKKWLRAFASSVSMKQYTTYIKDQYIWHVFTFRLVPDDTYLSGDQAREAYNRVNKSGARYVKEYGGKQMNPLPETLEKACELDNMGMHLTKV